MRTAELSDDDVVCLRKLERKRDEEMRPPILSEFRVLALFVYQDEEGRRQEVVGANSECSNVGGALCAERSCMAQLQLLSVSRIVKIYIVSDADVCITPGTLCREFLSSSPFMRRDTPFISRARNCTPCVTTLEELYPFPFFYDKVPRKDLCSHAQKFCRQALPADADTSVHDMRLESLAQPAFVQSQLQYMDQDEQELYLATIKATQHDHRNDLLSLRMAAAMKFTDDDVRVTWQHKTLEYGSSLDAISKLIVFVDDKRIGTRYQTSADGKLEQVEASGGKPVKVIQTDQFGILHAPTARARAFFHENNYLEVETLVHGEDGKIYRVKLHDLVSESPDCIAATTSTS